MQSLSMKDVPQQILWRLDGVHPSFPALLGRPSPDEPVDLGVSLLRPPLHVLAHVFRISVEGLAGEDSAKYPYGVKDEPWSDLDQRVRVRGRVPYNLVVAHPYFSVGVREGHRPVHERLALGVSPGRAEGPHEHGPQQTQEGLRRGTRRPAPEGRAEGQHRPAPLEAVARHAELVHGVCVQQREPHGGPVRHDPQVEVAVFAAPAPLDVKHRVAAANVGDLAQRGGETVGSPAAHVQLVLGAGVGEEGAEVREEVALAGRGAAGAERQEADAVPVAPVREGGGRRRGGLLVLLVALIVVIFIVHLFVVVLYFFARSFF
mmetsp:Transcript_11464/g.22792  ORF Transcript_11464/g.22792 Transcript_11464/m.22792 type:complete len:318 (-) Transcript_11464:242-1195(-)